MASAAGKAEEEPAAPASPLAAAAERIRDSAKWLLGSFAAVGAILVAGLQLTGLGELEDGRLRWALGGLAVAVVGVVIAIGAAGAVVTKTFVTLKWLAQRPDGDPALDRIAGDKVVLGGYGSVGALYEAYRDAVEGRRDTYRAHAEDPTDPAKKQAADAAQHWALLLSGTQRHVLERASFSLLRHAYRTARRAILAAAVLTAAGIAAFAWAANPPDQPTAPVAVRTPTPVTVVVDEEDRPELQQRLGADCDLSDLDAVAVAAVGEVYEIVAVQTATCTPVLFRLGPDQGRVTVAAAPAADSAGD